MIVMNSTDTSLAIMGPLPQWLNFLAMFVGILLGTFGVLLWMVKFRKKRKRKRKHHHSHEKRQLNPTLAETGGLPPARENEKSSGLPPEP